MRKLNWKAFFIWWGTVFAVIAVALACIHIDWFGIGLFFAFIVFLIVAVSIEILNE